MGLYMPPAVSIDQFTGGYQAVSDYTDLPDTGTSDAVNVSYGPNADLEKRPGSLRLYPWFLSTTSATTTGRPITGYYFFDKLGKTSTYSIVAAGDALWSYSSATATVVRSTLTDNSNAFWSFIQIQDPRSAADDIVLGTNGVDPIQVWDGSASAVILSAFTSATGVPVARLLLNHKERVYAIGVIDAADADAPVKVMRTGFGSDGAADPHRFRETFYVGGSNRNGAIAGARVLNDQIIFYLRKSVWKFSPGSGDLGDLQELQGSVGLFAPFSLVDCGSFHIFLSERGVYAFDGVNFTHISEKVDEDLLKNANLSQLQFAKAEFNKKENQYVLYYPHGSSNRNDRALIYDLRLKVWQPPVTGRTVSYISTFDNASGLERVVYGDYRGFIYEDGIGTNDGRETGYNGTVSASTYTTLTDDGNGFNTSNNGLMGMSVRILAGTGEGQERLIDSNTSAVITLESQWEVPPDATSQYTVCGINGDWRSKDYDFGNHDLIKLFRHMYARVREEGDFSLILHYIVDFAQSGQETTALLGLLEDGFAWDEGVWDAVRWDGRATIRRKVSLRSTPSQSSIGTHLALRFRNGRANEGFRISGFDIEMQPLGKR